MLGSHQKEYLRYRTIQVTQMYLNPALVNKALGNKTKAKQDLISKEKLLLLMP